LSADRSSSLFASFPISDYLALARYRKWWIILTSIAVAIPAAVVAVRLPSIYRASTVIMIDAPQIPDSYVPSPVTSSAVNHLGEIQELVFSTTSLRKLIIAMNLYADRRQSMGEDALVQYMRRSISVDAVTQSGHNANAFQISYRSKDPVQATQVANQLAGMFIEQNAKIREEQSYGTANFLDSELQRTKGELEQKEAQLREMKTRYVLDLPESKSFHLQALETLRAQLRDSEDRVRSDQQQKVYFQSMMASYAPTVDLDTSTTGSVSTSQLQIQKLETSLGQLRARYGPAYPDVHKLQAQLEELKKRAAEEDADRPRASSQQVPRTVHNPVLESQLAKLDDDIKTQQKLQQDLQPQIEFHMSKLERIPIVEQQMADLMRDYDTVRTHYLAILDKKLSADTANSLEKRQKGERFFVLEPAQTPQKPFGPNRLLIGLAGVIGGLAGGIGLAILREMTDGSVRNEHEAASIAGGPVLVSVPAIFSEKDLRTRLWQGLGALSGTAVAGLALGYIASSVAGRLL